MKKKIVFVGISGGVDSAVSAALLQKEGHEVVGVFIKTWHPDFLVCNEEEERHDAMRVAAHLNIPFLTFNFEDVYKKEVADYMIHEYKMGRTPNPDVMCNKEVKFGAFLKKALAMGADYVATGHYARLERASRKLQVLKVCKGKKLYKLDELYKLLTGCDSTKDQSYFLWTLKQEQLRKILFPVGHLKKTEVRKLAKKFHLPVAEKKDSQGICFLGDIDLKGFLKHYIKPKKGKVYNAEGKEIGFHEGAVFNTLGERHGFTITKKNPNDGAYYVVGKDINKNILFVSQKSPLLVSARSCLAERGSKLKFTSPRPSPCQGEGVVIRLEDVNWISENYPLETKSYTCQVRYHGEFLPCKIKAEGPERSRRAEVIFEKPVLVASGQSCVIYDGDVCLGGGVVM
ncbi:MAG: tRNA 2-thiouridine(34) synthase MnmA [Candidatus Nomurabacteria bacterium]|nr:tRNA 2-thiouridine(34) synthase MnmA [Candidatus Nomurabacteria bacterium]